VAALVKGDAVEIRHGQVTSPSMQHYTPTESTQTPSPLTIVPFMHDPG
jgi:hypothetical protein